MIQAGSQLHQLMRQWRQDIHANPETAYQEHRTSKIVADLLRSFGLETHTGLAQTGVVAVLDGRLGPGSSIGLRADMDALNLQELNTFAHRSCVDGKMHACGHDGHTAMLLGAAKYLSENPDFSGRVVFIFQPAEEGEAGAKAMCDEGLFEQFPVDAIYGMHNWPALQAGQFAVHAGPVMAAMDFFDIHITGNGAHAGMPHLGVDPIAVAGQLITSLQSIVARTLNPADSGVLSITQMRGGDAYNVIPNTVSLGGTVRSFSSKVQQQIQSAMQSQVEQICAAFGATGVLEYRRLAPATVNDSEHADICASAAQSLVGEASVLRHEQPSMGAEDFAYMLQHKPGAYIWIGNGSQDNDKSLHNPRYDFNDEISALGASYWVSLVREVLAA